MNITQPNRTEDRKVSTILIDLKEGMQNLVKSEIHLARAEFEVTAKEAGKNVALVVTFGVIALLGTLPFLAFLVIGLGELLNHNYWLSSLIVSVICMVIGGICGSIFAKKLTHQDYKFPHTRHSIEDEAKIVRGKFQEVTETVQRRAS